MQHIVTHTLQLQHTVTDNIPWAVTSCRLFLGFFFNLESLTLQFEIISKQCCQDTSEALGPVFISQYQTVSRKSYQNICAV